MKPKDTDESANIIPNAYCKTCGWPIVYACCNDEFQKFEDAREHDYWAYCTNKGCKNHHGEGYAQAFPDWILYKKIN